MFCLRVAIPAITLSGKILNQDWLYEFIRSNIGSRIFSRDSSRPFNTLFFLVSCSSAIFTSSFLVLGSSFAVVYTTMKAFIRFGNLGLLFRSLRSLIFWFLMLVLMCCNTMGLLRYIEGCED